MARVERNPIKIPEGVEITLTEDVIKVKGKKGAIECPINKAVKVVKDGDLMRFAPNGKGKFEDSMAGTTRALVRNMILGVTEGYEKKLLLKGVGYKAQMKGNVLNLALGFSHPVDYPVPEGLTIQAPALTEIVISGVDKRLVGQTAAEIRRFRPPEPYQGKGIRYDDETVILKEGKKK